MRWILAALLFLTLPLTVWAHDMQLSGVRILSSPADSVISVTTHLSRLAAAEGVDQAQLDSTALDRAIRRRLRLRFEGKDFVPGTASVLRDPGNDIVVWQARYAGVVAEPDVLARLYPEDDTSRFLVTFIHEGQVVRETLLTGENPTDTLRPGKAEAVFSVALRYVREGVAHIFGGPDHVCFVLGLLLLGGSLPILLRTVTAFTAAHSITLTLAATGTFLLPGKLIEPIIALSIVAIAAENLRVRRGSSTGTGRRDLRPYLAFGFGLIHGFGFAGALAEVGLPREALGIALASFNAGVEMGQAAIVLAVAPVLGVIARPGYAGRQHVIRIGSTGIALAGIYWFIIRIL